MSKKRTRVLACSLAVMALLAASCGGDDDDDGVDAGASDSGATTTQASTTAEDGDSADGGDDADGAASGWTVDASDCVDPDSVDEPIEGTIKLGTTAPLTGGPATAFAPTIDGMRAYIDFANENDLVPGYELELMVEDDQYNKDLTPGAVNTLLDDGAAVIAALIGSANNLAVRDLLDEECVPQMSSYVGSPDFGLHAGYQWAFILQLPYDLESRAYMTKVAEDHPDGATAAIFYNSTETGQLYADAWDRYSADYGIDLVESQTIEAADSAPPTAQVNTIAAAAPDVIMAVPTGSACATFLSELANAKAANAGWEPEVYLTSTCASPLILGAAGEAADGLFTFPTGGVEDVADPATVESDADVAEFVAYMEERGQGDIVSTAVAGWNAMDVTVAMLAQAAETGEVTRRSIIEQARDFSYEPRLARDGITYDLHGEDDTILLDTAVLLEYDAAAGTFAAITDAFQPAEG